MGQMMEELTDIMVEACIEDNNFELVERLEEYIKREKKDGRI